MSLQVSEVFTTYSFTCCGASYNLGELAQARPIPTRVSGSLTTWRKTMSDSLNTTPMLLGNEEVATKSTTHNLETGITTCLHQCSQGGKGKQADRYQVATRFNFAGVSKEEERTLAAEQLLVKWRQQLGFSNLESVDGTDNQTVSVREMLDNQRKADYLKRAKSAASKMSEEEKRELLAELQASLG